MPPKERKPAEAKSKSAAKPAADNGASQLQGVASRNRSSLSNIFYKFDSGAGPGDSKLDIREFRRCFEHLQLRKHFTNAQLDDIFKSADKDSDGKLNLQEFIECFSRPSTAPAASTPDAANGLAARPTTAPGAASLKSSPPSSGGLADRRRESLGTMFFEMDDGDKMLDLKEFRTILKLLGMSNQFTDEELELLFQSADADGSGKIDVDEFLSFAGTATRPTKSQNLQRSATSATTSKPQSIQRSATSASTLNLDELSDKDRRLRLLLRAGAPIGFKLGGKSGNHVTEGSQQVKKGWKALAVNGVERSGSEIIAELKKKLPSKRCSVVFFVDDQTARKQQQRRIEEAAKQAKLRAEKLEDVMKTLGVNDLHQLESLSDTDLEQRRNDIVLQACMIKHGALFEEEILMGHMTASVAENTVAIYHCLQDNDVNGAGLFVEHCDVTARDESGNVALHYCHSGEAVELLLTKSSEVRHLCNMAGRPPVHEITKDKASKQQWEILQSFGLTAQTSEELLILDSNGISGAMRLSGEAREWVEKEVPSWDVLSKALESGIEGLIANLENCHPQWQQVLAFHCFGDKPTYSEGKHTSQSSERVLFIWKIMSKLIHEFKNSSEAAEQPLRHLLNSTKGPKHETLDSREPYRKELATAMHEIDQMVGKYLSSQYEKMKAEGEDARWLTQALKSETSKGLATEVRMDFRHSVPEARGLEPPSWLKDGRFSMLEAAASLQDMGEIAADRNRDAMYDFFKLARFGATWETDSGGLHEDLVACMGRVSPELKPLAQNLHKDFVMCMLYAAWLRGTCQKHQKAVDNGLRKLLQSGGCLSNVKVNMRENVKGFARMSEKILDVVVDTCSKMAGDNTIPSDNLREKVRLSAALIKDINGGEIVASSVTDVKRVHRAILEKHKTGSACLLQTKNGFEQIQQADYRDMKLIVGISTAEDEASSSSCDMLLLELQLHLKEFHSQKHMMHLPYEIGRGSFDWPHVTSQANNEGTLRQLAMDLLEGSVLAKSKAAATLRAMGEKGVTSLAHMLKHNDDRLRAASAHAMGFLKTSSLKIEHLNELAAAMSAASPLKEQAKHALENLCSQAVHICGNEFTNVDASTVKRCLIKIDKVMPLFSAKACYSADLDAKAMKHAGYDASVLRSAGYTALQLISGEFAAVDFRKAGFTASELCQSFGIAELQQAGFSAAELREAGSNLEELKKVGFAADALKQAAFSAQELKIAGFAFKDMTEAGFKAHELKEAGFTLGMIKNAGFTLGELKQADFKAEELNQAGFTLQDLTESDFSAKELKKAGFTSEDLKEAGMAARDLKGKFTPYEMKKAGFSARQLREAGFPAGQLKVFTLAEMKNAGFSAQDLKEYYELKSSFTLNELQTEGFELDDMKDAGFDAHELKQTGSKLEELVKHCSVDELKQAGFTLDEFRHAGVEIRDLKKAHFSAHELKQAGFTLDEMKKAEFSADELKHADITLDELKKTGFTVQELCGAFRILELVNVGFRLTELVKAFSPSELQQAGYDADQLKRAGLSPAELKQAGFEAEDLRNLGLRAHELKEAGFGVAELKAAGFKHHELISIVS